MKRGFVARALVGGVIGVGVLATMPSCVRKSDVHLRCTRACQGDSDRCLTGATQSAEVQTCKESNAACVDACPP